MTLSEPSTGNIDWTLDKILSASRESRQYVERSNLNRVEEDPVFSPWVPRKLPDTVSEPGPAEVNEEIDAEKDIESISPNFCEVIPRSESGFDDEGSDRENLESEKVLEEIKKAFEEGRLQGYSEAEEKYLNTEKSLHELIDALSNIKIDVTEFQRTIAELSTFIASKIIRAEILINPEWIESLVEKCIQEIRHHGHDPLTVKLSIDDFDLIGQDLIKRHEHISFERDEDLRTGDMEISMGAASITENTEEKLQKISEQLLESLKKNSYIQEMNRTEQGEED